MIYGEAVRLASQVHGYTTATAWATAILILGAFVVLTLVDARLGTPTKPSDGGVSKLRFPPPGRRAQSQPWDLEPPSPLPTALTQPMSRSPAPTVDPLATPWKGSQS